MYFYFRFFSPKKNIIIINFSSGKEKKIFHLRFKTSSVTLKKSFNRDESLGTEIFVTASCENSAINTFQSADKDYYKYPFFLIGFIISTSYCKQYPPPFPSTSHPSPAIPPPPRKSLRVLNHCASVNH